MTPSIGRVIHMDPVAENEECSAAIITGRIRPLFGAGDPPDSPSSYTFNATVFAISGPSGEAARRIIVRSDTRWHDPRDCDR